MSDEFTIDPDAVRSVAGNLGGILMQAITLSRDLERLVVPPISYAQIGSPVATGGAQLQTEQVQALHSMLGVLSDLTHQVSAVAASSQQLDTEIGSGLDRLTGGGLWGSPTAGQLASAAMAGSSLPGHGQSVDGVLDYMGRVGMGQLGSHPVAAGSFASPTALVDWLDTDPDNQARLGVIGVYAGDSGNLANVPGGVHPGDLVYVSRWQLGGPDFTAGSTATLGVLGSDGQLYNQGAISTSDWHGVTNLRVYRPLSGAL
ncbi:MAG: ESX-1 secretion-associated protein [Actinomycetota bacterium]|nr:ESX-1 secretion-associated protein [Actinomycetota bacterium]